MPIETTYSSARQRLAELMDRVTGDREIVIINRRGHEDVAMIAAAELSSLLETAYLLRSPKNARRLLESLQESLDHPGPGESLDDLGRELGVERG
jgi:antitoxin YefM